uniref:7TM_GPCR_Srx domain-containing protein n=2 Tax=Steinernema glaseri TaxID=37863 RepID=A0A1I7YBH1_9BILA
MPPNWTIPFCTATGLVTNWDHSLVDDPDPQRAIGIGVSYLLWGVVALSLNCFVFSVISCPPLIQYSCYKLMSINTLLDIANNFNGLILGGFFSIFEINHCNPKQTIWAHGIGMYAYVVWALYTAASEVLAVNRLLEFTSPRVSRFLFEGKRCWLWIIYIFLYATIATVVAPDAFYFYDPWQGMYFNLRIHHEINYVHIVNNLSKFGIIIFCYTVMIILLLYFTKNMRNISKIQVKAFVIGLLAAGVNIGYLAITYTPSLGSLDPYRGVIGQILWQMLHCLVRIPVIRPNLNKASGKTSPLANLARSATYWSYLKL